MSTNTIKFFNRPQQNSGNVDYISMVNNSLIKDPTSIDPNSSVYSEAIKQYNGELKKGNTTRLEVPVGFCGYIDPTSGDFRVVPDPDLSSIPPGQEIPNTLNIAPTSTLIEGEYPIDACLAIGLAGSPSYSQIAARIQGEMGEYTKITATSCGSADDVVTASGVNWNFIPVNYCIDPTPAQACMSCWQEEGECAIANEEENGEGGDAGDSNGEQNLGDHIEDFVKDYIINPFRL